MGLQNRPGSYVNLETMGSKRDATAITKSESPQPQETNSPTNADESVPLVVLSLLLVSLVQKRNSVASSVGQRIVEVTIRHRRRHIFIPDTSNTPHIGKIKPKEVNRKGKSEPGNETTGRDILASQILGTSRHER